nr:MAG TPA: hypothetical protein [Caudoviricetes sp.]
MSTTNIITFKRIFKLVRLYSFFSNKSYYPSQK